MTAPVVPDLATNTVARKYVVQINTGTVSAPVWTSVGGQKSWQFTSDDAVMQDDRRYSDKGANRQNKTGTGWNGTLTVSRAPQVLASTAYDIAQEYLRSKGEGNIGPSAEVGIRWFEFDPDVTLPRVQSYAGRALVTYNEPNGGATDNSDATFTFTGQGFLLKPAHPYPVAAAVPVITGFRPSTAAAAGGTLVHIDGSGFTGATAVTFGGTAATNFSVESDALIIATAPAKAAGPVSVVVTTPAGASAGNNLNFS